MAIQTIAQMKAYAQTAGLPDASIAAAIGEAESSGNDQIVNAIGCVGCMQINQPAWYPSKGWTVAWLQNPANNFAAAKVVYDAQGWQAWTTYTSGAYKKYLSKAQASASTSTSIVNPLNPIKTGTQVGQGISTLNQINNFLGGIENTHFWVRLLYIIVGIICCLVAIANLTAASKTVQGAVKTGARIAEVVPK